MHEGSWDAWLQVDVDDLWAITPASLRPVHLLTDAAAPRHQREVARSSWVGPMLGLAVALPALLFSVATVVLAAREEQALQPDLAVRQIRQSGGDGPPDGGSMRKVR